jgi:class 3 adenylate cyclase/pimeloyl-ACP methyl ester carboxylesterase
VIEGSEGRRTATVTMLFCDLVGSTERQSRLGDDAADEFRRRFFAALQECVRATDGEVVKNLGDGLMVVFRHSAVDAVRCGIAMHERVEPLDADDPPQLYVGISAGEAAQEDGDWFGTPVVEAARLCAAAKPGQTLANEVVRTLVGSRGSFSFRSVGALTLKGIREPVASIEIVRDGASAAPAERTGPPRPKRRRPVLIAAAAGLAVVIIAVAVVALTRKDEHSTGASTSPSHGVPAAVGYTPHYTTSRCPDDVAKAVTGVTCGTLTVPEDRTHPANGHSVKLLVTRAPARDGATDDPVLDFGADQLAQSPVRDHADEIQLSQRGFAPSEPALTCPDYARIAPEYVTRSIDDARSLSDATSALGTCRSELVGRGIDPNMYTLTQVGDDMLDLMRALRLQRVNLVSGFVVTVSALQVVRAAPDAVQTLTLQTPVAPGQSTLTDPTAYFHDAFNRYVALCESDPACARSFPDLPGRFEQGHAAAAKSPRLVSVKDDAGQQRSVRLDGDRLAQAVYAALFDRSTYPLLASGIWQSASPSVDDLTAQQILRYNNAFVTPGFEWGAYLSLHCSYDVANLDASGHKLSDQTLPAYSGVDDGFLEAVCPTWKVHALPEVASDDGIEYDVPTLIANGALMPSISSDWVTGLQRQMPKATAITFGTLDGSILYDGGPSCFSDMRRTFVHDPAAHLDVEHCEGESPPIRFVASPSP